jgi:hypothetical protein
VFVEEECKFVKERGREGKEVVVFWWFLVVRFFFLSFCLSVAGWWEGHFEWWGWDVCR